MGEEMSDPWAELEKKYARGAVADTQGSGDPWADLEAKYARQKPESPQQQPAQQTRPRKSSPLTNFAQGFNQGVAGLAGLPVDTALNVADLATAGYGAIKGALGGKDLPETSNRKNYVGSSEWILQKLRNVSPDIADPADPSSLIAAAGRGIGGSLGFGGTANLGRQAAMGAASGIGAQVGGEMGGVPGAVMGGMIPGIASAAAPMAVRAAVRGRDGSQMTQNLETLKAAGVESPTVGQASGNNAIRALENTLARIPISGGVMRNNAQETQSQLQRTVKATRDASSPNYGHIQSGRAIEKGIADFNAMKQAEASNLYNQINIPWNQQFQTPNILSAVQNMTRPIPGAPALSGGLLGKSSGLPAELRAQLQSDQAGTVGIPYEAIKQARSVIGEKIPQQIWDRAPGIQQTRGMYGALSDDLKSAAATAGQLPQFNRANNYYRGLTDRMDAVSNFADKAAPEASYAMFKSAMKNSGSEATKLVRTLPEPQRRVLAATAIDELGTSVRSQQDGGGTRFSSETFLSNWNGLDKGAKDSLFGSSLGGSQIRKNLDKVADVASMVRDQSKIVNNSSGTSQGAAYIGGLASAGAAAGAVMSGNPWAVAPAAMAGLGLYGGAKALTYQPFSAWLAKSTEISPKQQAQHMARLGVLIQQTKDPETQKQMLNYYNGLTP